MKTMLIAIVALATAGAAGAQTNASMAKGAMPVAKPAPVAKAKPAATAAAPGKTATVTTKTGKKITYDCTKKGNMNKKACKA